MCEFYPAEQVKKLFHLEIEYSAIESTAIPYEESLKDQRYTVTPEDLLIFLEKLYHSEYSLEKIFDEWFNPLSNIIEFKIPRTASIKGLPDFTDVYGNIMFSDLDEFFETFDEEDDDEFSAILEGNIEYLKKFIENEKLPIEQRDYAPWEKENFLRYWESDILNSADKQVKELYLRYVNELCEEGYVTALRIKAYGCYGGNEIFPCDWDISCSYLTKLLEATAEPYYATSLGYIYYYGRCNNGIPEYEKAFYYFSIGSAGEIPEAKYKMADMFANGYGVPESKEIAYHIVSKLYSQLLKQIQNGNFDCNFADVAFRMGNYTNDGIGQIYRNSWKAYKYYLLAEYAIKMRMSYYDWYGDSSVANRIHEALEKIRKEIDEEYNKDFEKESGKVFSFCDFWQLLECAQYPLMLKIKHLENGEYSLTFRTYSQENEEDTPNILVVLPEAGFCGMMGEITIQMKSIAPMKEEDIDKPIIFDESNGKTLFLHGEEVAEFHDDFTIVNPKITHSKKYRMATVVFQTGGKQYDYFCDIADVSAGDTVIVNSPYNGETEVTVIKISEKSETELILPLKKYKSILRKA